MPEVTDATFQTAVLERSTVVPVVVDLWAPWCAPCKALGPILERVVGNTDGAVELAKVNVDENPQISGSFQVQSIPAVFAIKNGQVVDRFVGALPESEVATFVAGLTPPPSEIEILVAAGDEGSLRSALEIQSDHPGAVAALVRLLLDKGAPEEALFLLGRVPETADLRALAAEARLAGSDVALGGDVDGLLEGLLTRVKEDEAARQEFIDVLETLGPDDPRTARFRKALAAALF